MSDVFISYSREDGKFVAELQGRLESQQRDVWIDWEDIPPTAEWLQEIYHAIEAADTFIFVVSPGSVASRTCLLELAHAQAHHKRIVPLLAREVDPEIVPEAIGKINWVTFQNENDFETSMSLLNTALDLDLAWVRAHTRLLVRAKEWESKKQDSSYLLEGTDLLEARRWLSEATRHEPKLIDLQKSYIAASEQGAIADRKKQLRGFYIVSIIYSVSLSGISYFALVNEISETGLMFLSPIWLLGLVFGVVGLTVAQDSLGRSIIITLMTAFGLFVFFNTIWNTL